MSTIYRCDYCGKEELAVVALVHERKDTAIDAHLRTPDGWMSQFNGVQVLDVCSPECSAAYDEREYRLKHQDGSHAEENDNGSDGRRI